MEQQLDHGYLNLPLAKRGDINAQIDAYKREEAAKQKATAKEKAALHKENQARAKLLLANMPADQVACIAEKAGLTIGQCRKKLESIAYWEPSKVIALSRTGATEAAKAHHQTQRLNINGPTARAVISKATGPIEE